MNNIDKAKRAGYIFAEVVEFIIFQSRWLLAPLYACLVMGMFKYFVWAMIGLIHPTEEHAKATEANMLMLLGLVDITMVGNLRAC